MKSREGHIDVNMKHNFRFSLEKQEQQQHTAEKKTEIRIHYRFEFVKSFRTGILYSQLPIVILHSFSLILILGTHYFNWIANAPI